MMYWCLAAFDINDVQGPELCVDWGMQQGPLRGLLRIHGHANLDAYTWQATKCSSSSILLTCPFLYAAGDLLTMLCSVSC